MTVLTLLLKNWCHISGECQRLVGRFRCHAGTGPHHAHPDRDARRNEPGHRITESGFLDDAAAPPGISSWCPHGRPPLEHLTRDFHSSSPKCYQVRFPFPLSASALYARTAALVPVFFWPRRPSGELSRTIEVRRDVATPGFTTCGRPTLTYRGTGECPQDRGRETGFSESGTPTRARSRFRGGPTLLLGSFESRTDLMLISPKAVWGQ